MSKVFRGVCALGVTIAGLAAGAGIAGTAQAAEEDATWVSSSDGCVYLSDGYVNYQAACQVSASSWDFYVADSGQWIPWLYTFTDFYGCTHYWSTTDYLGSTCV